MIKDIDNRNIKGEWHGYQEWYRDSKLCVKCFYHNNIRIDYREYHYYGSNDKLKKTFYI